LTREKSSVNPETNHVTHHKILDIVTSVGDPLKGIVILQPLLHIPDLNRPLQPDLAELVRLARLLPSHIVDPSPIRPDLLPLRELGGKIQPGQRVPHRADLVADGVQRVVGHPVIELLVRPQLVEVLRHGVGVAHVDEEPVPVVLHLERDAARERGDDGLALVDGFGDLDLEPLSRGELQGDLGLGQQRVEDLVRRMEPHHTDVLGEVGDHGLDVLNHRVVDQGAVRVVD